MLSEKLLLPQVPQPIDSENGRPLSKLPPVAMQCAWFDDHARHRQVQPELERALLACAVCSPTEWPAPWYA